MMSGWDWGVSGRVAALAATYCLEQTGPQNHAYTCAEFARRYRECFGDAVALKELAA